MGTMRAPEISYYPAELTDEELALLEWADQPTPTPELADDLHESELARSDIPAALGSIALTITGGILDTPPLEAKPTKHEVAPIADGTIYKLGNIAITQVQSRELAVAGFNLTVMQTSREIPSTSEWSAEAEAAADAAYLLAIQSNSRNMTDQAIKQATYGLAA